MVLPIELIVRELCGSNLPVRSPDDRGSLARMPIRRRWASAKGVSIVAFGGVRFEPAPGLGGDVERLLPLAAELPQKAFTSPISVDIRRVEEIHTLIQGKTKRGE